ncbi:MAG: hypothetical protein ABR514_10325 [Chthoniobacterales bacterium]
MTAAQIYESVTNGGTTDFADVVAILHRHRPGCLIGGLAVNCYVEPVYTLDVDLVVITANLSPIERELGDAGFKVERFAHLMNAGRTGSKLNVQFTTDGRYQEFLEEATAREVLGINVPVASLENIVRGKIWAWQDAQPRLSKRKKDELDLIRIGEAHPALGQLIPEEIAAHLG